LVYLLAGCVLVWSLSRLDRARPARRRTDLRP
jgi:hypothetical protein